MENRLSLRHLVETLPQDEVNLFKQVTLLYSPRSPENRIFFPVFVQENDSQLVFVPYEAISEEKLFKIFSLADVDLSDDAFFFDKRKLAELLYNECYLIHEVVAILPKFEKVNLTTNQLISILLSLKKDTNNLPFVLKYISLLTSYEMETLISVNSDEYELSTTFKKFVEIVNKRLEENNNDENLEE